MGIFSSKSLWEPSELVRFLVTANVVLFVTSLLFAPGLVNTSLSPMVFLSPPPGVLYKLGASGTLPVFSEDRWWTLITANYLHGSLLHLVFNVMALRSVGQMAISIFGVSRFFMIYFLGGIASMAISSLAGIPLTLGASGAICALIGCTAYDDWRANEGNLKLRIASVGVWVLFIAVIGLTLPNVNNWAHASGFAAGFLLGFCFWPRVTLKNNNLFRKIATVCMLGTIGSLIYGLLLS
jgi:rhomboid protease GluP